MSTSTFTPAIEMYRCKYGETPKLTSTNYSTWRTDIESFLRTEDVLEIVRGNEPAPLAGVQAIQRYRSRVGKAYGLISNSCTAPIKIYIRDMEDPTEIWNTLKEKLDTASSRAGQLALAHTFGNLRPLNSDTSISQYITRLMDIRDQLAGTTQELSDEKMVGHLLTTLPPSFNIIRRVITHSPLEMQTFDYVINTLMEEEKTMHNEFDNATNASTSLTSGSALTASTRGSHRGRGNRGNHGNCRGRGSYGGRVGYRGRGGYRSSRGRGRGIDKSTSNDISSHKIYGSCWHCGNRGHMMSECWKLQREQREQQEQAEDDLPDTRAQGTIVVARGTMAVSRRALVSTHNNRNSNNRKTEWIVDSGASHHLCRERHDFQTLHPLSRQIEVIIGDGSPMIASAKGIIKLSLPSGRTLTIEALLVPRLHTSLLSVSELAKTEYVQFFDDHCFLSGRAIGRRQGGIFNFLGTVKRQWRASHLATPIYTSTSISTSMDTLTSTKGMSTQVTYSLAATLKPNLELWHQRLGHLGMQSVKALLKMQAQPEDVKMVDIADIHLESGQEGEENHEENEDTELCPTCVKAKIRRKFARKPVEHTKQPYELVHSDLCGPISPPS